MSLNMKGIFFIILTSMWKKGCSAPWGRVRGILNALNPKVRQQGFFVVTKVHMFLFVLTMSLNMKEAYFHYFDVYVEKGLQRPLGKGQGHFKCIKSKGQTTSNMLFFVVTTLPQGAVHMFLFVLTMSLNMKEAYFSLFWRLCGKRAAAPPGEGSGAF